MVSIVIPSRSPEKLAAARAHYHAVFAGEAHEVVAMVDPPSMCEAYNRGLERSRGEVVVFSHDDVEFLDPPTMASRLLGHLERCDVVGVAGTSRLLNASWALTGPPYLFGQVVHPVPAPRGSYAVAIYGTAERLNVGMQAMDGLFLAFRREAIEALRWDGKTFDSFHVYDMDVTFRAYLAGYRLGVACDLGVLHASPGSYDHHWAEHANRFADKHGERLSPAPAYFSRRPFSEVEVGSREEALARMSPPHWGAGRGLGGRSAGA